MTTSTPFDPLRVLVLDAGPALGADVARRFGREFAIALVAHREQGLADLAGQLGVGGVTVDTVTAGASDPHGFRTALADLAEPIASGVVVYNAASIASDNVLSRDLDYLVSTYDRRRHRPRNAPGPRPHRRRLLGHAHPEPQRVVPTSTSAASRAGAKAWRGASRSASTSVADARWQLAGDSRGSSPNTPRTIGRQPAML